MDGMAAWRLALEAKRPFFVEGALALIWTVFVRLGFAVW